MEGNEGNEGNVGSYGGSSGGGGVLPDRVDVPFVTVRDIDAKRSAGTKWLDRSWTGDWYAWLMLVDFAQYAQLPYQKPTGAPDPTRLWLASPAETQAGMQGAPDDEKEILRLIRLAEDERADALGEIIAQSEGFIDYFLAAMSISRRSHPRTCRLLYVGSMIGAYVSMHFKGVYQRRRPCQRAPALSPPIRVPGHPSYPSGHATQSHLMVKCLQALPDIEAQITDVLDVLAMRIARNREIAGLHFHSDTVAGRALADAAFTILSSASMPQTVPTAIPPDATAPSKRRFQKLVADANEEWT